jgi:hypothetical protein
VEVGQTHSSEEAIEQDLIISDGGECGAKEFDREEVVQQE